MLDTSYRTAYNEDHEAFRDTVRKVFAQHLEPDLDKHEEDGIVLRRNDRISLMHSEGTLVLTGPLRLERIERPDSENSRFALSSLTRQASARRSRIGGTRNFRERVEAAAAQSRQEGGSRRSADARVPTIWHIDPSLEGDWCYFDDEELEVWRVSSDKSTEVFFAREGSEMVKFRWSEGEHFAYWPYRMAPSDGARYSIRSQGSFDSFVTLHRVDFEGDLLALARSLDEKDCFHQLELIAGDSSNES